MKCKEKLQELVLAVIKKMAPIILLFCILVVRSVHV